MGDERVLLRKNTLLIAVLLSCICSGAYACMISGPSRSYSLCRQIALLGAPGILIAAVILIALRSGHGGGPLAELLASSAPINFLFYTALGVTARTLWRMLNKQSDKST
jgi:hypothetical protein